jgi:pyruvate-formate lyase
MFTKTFFKNGGTHIQYNITDKKELEEARVKPEEHNDLVVRIAASAPILSSSRRRFKRM